MTVDVTGNAQASLADDVDRDSAAGANAGEPGINWNLVVENEDENQVGSCLVVVSVAVRKN